MNQNLHKIEYSKIASQLVNRETIAYVIAGVLTTAVNFCSYIGLYYSGIRELTANAIAWVIAVIFAYIVNKKSVFLSKSRSMTEEITKVGKFFSSRVVTLGIEQLGMYLFIYRLGFYHLAVKASLAVIVTLLNYIFSKLYIFSNNNSK